ncbi:hypothetical protein E6P70_07995, partial [Moraxella nonliquefaciens]|uniref:hypothetical protein n=1 Tax=Moraxella nonliquefaciens TaxID=478 RepID=UPI0024ADBA04
MNRFFNPNRPSSDERFFNSTTSMSATYPQPLMNKGFFRSKKNERTNPNRSITHRGTGITELYRTS